MKIRRLLAILILGLGLTSYALITDTAAATVAAVAEVDPSEDQDRVRAPAAGTIYVDQNATGANDGTTWTNAYIDLQSALGVATTGDEIWVAAGTYKPTGGADRTATFQLVSGVPVYGGFAGTETARGQRKWANNPTILSGDLNGDDVGFTNNGENSYHVVTGSSTDGTAVLDGFIVSGGNADGGDPHHRGGGMVNSGGSPTVVNVAFNGNAAFDRGGGMYNQGGSNPTLVNVIFSGNGASYGGGMFNDSSNPTLVNVTFSSNTASHGGGGVYNWSGSNPTLTNCILWGNAAPAGAQISGGSPTVTYSVVQGGYSGTGNVSADPLFVDADGADDVVGTLDDDLGLKVGSSAVDAGNNSAVPPGVLLDLAGNPRFLDVAGQPDTGAGTPPIVDMGAYEAACVDLVVTKAVAPTVAASGGPLTYTLTFSNAGSLTATSVVLTDVVPISVIVSSVVGSGVVITDTGAIPAYVWDVANLAAGERGVVTIASIVNPSVSGVFSLTNQAAIASAVADWNLNDNTSAVTNTIDAVPPEPPALVSPANGVVISDTTPVLTWGTSPSAAGYLLDWNGTVVDVGNVTQHTTAVLADGVYAWTVAAYDGLRNISAYTDTWSFVLDTASPRILATAPPDGAWAVARGAAVVITFSEPVDTGTFAYTVVPDPGGWSTVWSGGGSVVTLDHDLFAPQTEYTFTVTSADDPVGNPLSGAPVTWRFSTAVYRAYLPLVVRGFP